MEQRETGRERGRVPVDGAHGASSFETIYGVDFSGARLAGRTTFVARTEPLDDGRLRLLELDSLERLAGSAERSAALAHLVAMIRGSRDALWAIDAPFGLPIELLEARQTWTGFLRFVEAWKEDGYDLGLWALAKAKALGGPNHIRRFTDVEARAPFDPYHYRIIYQTYHAMRDVVAPLVRERGTAVLPFHYRRLAAAHRVVVEACPSSTLKRLGLPHQNYKQPAGGPLTPRRRRTRHAILAGLGSHVEISPLHRRRIMRDPGGDAMDAVISAVGAWIVWRSVDHERIARDRRVVREGYLYA